MRLQRVLLVSIIVSFSCISSLLAKNEPHKKGRYRITFDNRSLLSSLEEMKERGLINKDKLKKAIKANSDYIIEDETYEVLVPDNYDPSKSMGLFIWISAGDGGGAPGSLVTALTKHGFIYIGANMSGNKNLVTRRYGLAIDAAVNMQELYNIDTNRVYISGNSGGGRCASVVAPVFPDVFTGGALYVIGCDFWDRIPIGDGSTKSYPGFWKKNDRKLLRQAEDHYFVFLTGSKDFNRLGTIGAYKAYEQAGFSNCKYIEVPDMGHSTPPAEYFDEGLAFLNSSLQKRGIAMMGEGIQKVKSRKYTEAIAFFLSAKGLGVDEAQDQLDKINARVDVETEKGMKYLAANKTSMARVQFQKVVRIYSEDLAVKAKVELDKIMNDPAIANARKADQIFRHIRKNYKIAGRTKTATDLKKLIADYPDTVAAGKAKTTLDKMGI